MARLWVEKGWGNNSDREHPGSGKGNEMDNPAAAKGEQKSNRGQSKKQQEDDLCAEAELPSTEKPATEPTQDELPVNGNEQTEAAEGTEPKHERLKLQQETTSYLYDGLGLNILKEYKGTSSPKAEYYYANGPVLGRKMFGLKGSILPDREAGMSDEIRERIPATAGAWPVLPQRGH